LVEEDVLPLARRQEERVLGVGADDDGLESPKNTSVQ